MSLHRRHRANAGHRSHARPRLRRGDHTRLGPSFAKLWGAGVVSNVADGITTAALPLLAAILSRDPLTVASIAALHALPWIVFELVAGEIADRVDRRKLILFGNTVRAIGMTVLAVLVASDSIELWSLGLLAFGIGIAETLVDTTWEAIVPRIVPTEHLEVANGRSQAAEWTANEFGGPPLGGLLFAAATALPFAFNAGAYVVAALLVAAIPGTFASAQAHESGIKAMRREIGEGIQWLWHNPIIRTLSLTAGVANLIGTAQVAVFVLFAQEILEVGNTGFGLILAAIGIGGIIGASLAHRVEAMLGPGTMLLGSITGVMLASALIAVTSSPVAVGMALALDGFLIAIWNVTVVSLRQTLTPDDLRGRVASVSRTIAFGAGPIGAILGGILARGIGLRAPFYVGAAVYAITLIIMRGSISNSKIEDVRRSALGSG